MQLLSGKASTLWKTFLIALLILILGRFLIVGQAKVLFNTISSDGDEAAHLSLGLDLLEEGILTDGVRPPLYPLLLTPFAEREWAYFTWAKMLTLGLGAGAVLATFLVGKSLFSWEAGLLATFLLAANKEFHLRASTVYTDVLFVSTFLGAWYFLIKSFQGWRYCIMAGIFVGLAYLSKGSAPLLLGAWAITALLHYRSRIWQHRELLFVPALFLVTASPLLLYNATVFDNPFYSFASTHVLWMDSWDQSQVADPADLPTLSTYLQTHTAADIVDRFQSGFVRLNAFLPRVLIPSRTLEPSWLGPALLMSILIMVGVLIIWRREWLVEYYRHNRLAIILSVLLFAIFYIFSVWYTYVLVESRFFIPLLGPFYLLLADGFIRILRQIGCWAKAHRQSSPSIKRSVVWWAYLAGIAILLLWGGDWLVQTTQIDAWSLTVNPFTSDRRANAEVDQVMDWLVHDRPTGEARIIFGPSKSLPLWKFPRRFHFERIPIEVETWPSFNVYMRDVSPEYLIIDSDTARRRRKALSGYFTYQEEGVEFQHIPEGWTLSHLTDEAPYTWTIFEPSSPPTNPLAANLGNRIELLGYDLNPATVEADRTLRLTLYWRAKTRLTEDYTMFLHVTALDGFVKAQRDQQPLAGLWPTSIWSSGEVVADRYDITLDESIQPGDYLLNAGVYTLQTGERLPLLEGPSAPSPDAILLGKIEVN